MSGDEPRSPILKGSDVVKVDDDKEQTNAVSLFPALRPGDVLKITSVDDLGDFDLGQLVAIREIDHEEPALSVESGSQAEEAIRAAGVVGARVTRIDDRTVTLEVTDSAEAVSDQ